MCMRENERERERELRLCGCVCVCVCVCKKECERQCEGGSLCVYGEKWAPIGVILMERNKYIGCCMNV